MTRRFVSTPFSEIRRKAPIFKYITHREAGTSLRAENAWYRACKADGVPFLYVRHHAGLAGVELDLWPTSRDLTPAGVSDLELAIRAAWQSHFGKGKRKEVIGGWSIHGGSTSRIDIIAAGDLVRRIKTILQDEDSTAPVHLRSEPSPPARGFKERWH